MKIRIAAWAGLEGTGYANGQTVTGTKATAVRIAGEIFRAGRDVLLRHSCTGVLVIQCYPKAHRDAEAEGCPVTSKKVKKEATKEAPRASGRPRAVRRG